MDFSERSEISNLDCQNGLKLEANTRMPMCETGTPMKGTEICQGDRSLTIMQLLLR